VLRVIFTPCEYSHHEKNVSRYEAYTEMEFAFKASPMGIRPIRFETAWCGVFEYFVGIVLSWAWVSGDNFLISACSSGETRLGWLMLGSWGGASSFMDDKSKSCSTESSVTCLDRGTGSRPSCSLRNRFALSRLSWAFWSKFGFGSL